VEEIIDMSRKQYKKTVLKSAFIKLGEIHFISYKLIYFIWGSGWQIWL